MLFEYRPNFFLEASTAGSNHQQQCLLNLTESSLSSPKTFPTGQRKTACFKPDQTKTYRIRLKHSKFLLENPGFLSKKYFNVTLTLKM